MNAASLPASATLRKLLARFPLRPACCLAPSQRSSPQAISTVSSPFSMLSRSLSAKLSPTNYFHSILFIQHAASLPPSEVLRELFAPVPLRPACCIASSQQSSPRAISTVSCPSSMLSLAYLHVFLSVQHAVSLPSSDALRKLFPRFPLHPACCLAPSQRSSPQATCTVSCPSSMLSRSLPTKLSANYFHCFPSVQHAASLPASKALRELFLRFPIRPACCLAPSQRSCPQAIWTVSSPSSMLSRSLPAKLSASYFHGFLSAQHAVSLPPNETFPKLFPRFPIRPACCLAPSQRSSPQPICTFSYPSSMLSRSLPAQLSASHLHGFLSVQHAVSLLPSENLPKLFPRFRLCSACCLAPSQRSSPQAISTASSPSNMLYRSVPCCISPSRRSSPQAISTVSYPSSMLSRSLPAKISASYLHGFLSVQHAVSLRPMLHRSLPAKPSRRSSPQAFPRFPIRPACCLAPSRRRFPQAICTVSCPSSMLSRSLPTKLSTCCLAPSQRSSPPPICTVSYPSSMLSRSLPAQLSASDLHLDGPWGCQVLQCFTEVVGLS